MLIFVTWLWHFMLQLCLQTFWYTYQPVLYASWFMRATLIMTRWEIAKKVCCKTCRLSRFFFFFVLKCFKSIAGFLVFFQDSCFFIKMVTNCHFTKSLIGSITNCTTYKTNLILVLHNIPEKMSGDGMFFSFQIFLHPAITGLTPLFSS